VKVEPRVAGTGGFTLLELLIVIVVLGILAGIVGFAVSNFRSDAVNSACRTDVRTLQTASAAYAVNHGAAAPDIDALVNGHYIQSAPKSGVTFADGVTNPATVDGCTGELAFTPDPPSSVPSGGGSVVSADGSTIRHDDTSPWTATVNVSVTDQDGAAVTGAAIAGTWSDGVSTDTGCTSGSNGSCSFDSNHTQDSPSVPVTWTFVHATKAGATLDVQSMPAVVCRYPSAIDKARDCQQAATA